MTSTQKKRTGRILWGIAAAAVALCCAAGLLNGEKVCVTKTTIAMGSVVQQTIYTDTESDAQLIASTAAERIRDLEDRISCKEEKASSSEIYALNTKRLATLSPDTIRLLTLGTDLQSATNGAYNIFVEPLTHLWDFDAETFHVPAQDTVSFACSQIPIASLTFEGDQAMLIGAGIDLGSLGKGAACDAAVELYREMDCTAAVVSVGGSIGLHGQKKWGSPWTIGVRDPNGTAADQLGTLELKACFISTSGTYEKTRESGGVTYHHLLDPTTGYPAETDLISATIICDNGALSDGLATACVLLGEKDAPALATAYDAEYILVTTDRRIIVSNGLREKFTLSADGYTLETGA